MVYRLHMDLREESSTADDTQAESSAPVSQAQRSTKVIPNKIPGAVYLPMRREQATMAVVLVFCCIGMGFYFWHRNIVEDGLIDIDRSPPVEVQYLVDINHAPWPAIANLPGIGPKLAREIVCFREQHGLFREIDDVKKVHGIGDAKLAAIREYVAPIAPAVAADVESQARN